jgi:hypothetical protein
MGGRNKTRTHEADDLDAGVAGWLLLEEDSVQERDRCAETMASHEDAGIGDLSLDLLYSTKNKGARLDPGRLRDVS